MNGNKFTTGQIMRKPVEVVKGRILLVELKSLSNHGCLYRHSPHLLVQATSERFLFKISLASESHWLQPMLVLSIHWWPTPIFVGGLIVNVVQDPYC